MLPIGIAPVGAWRYAFIYEILQRHYPDLPAQAREIKRSEARRRLVAQYLYNVVAASRTSMERALHVLRWTPKEWDRTLDALIEQGVAQQAQVGEGSELLYVSARLLHTPQDS